VPRPCRKADVSGAGGQTPYLFTGREDDGTSLDFYRARNYDPSSERFISEDPLGFGGGLNFCDYAHNNPVDATDPLGLFVTEDKIVQHRAIDIDPECGTDTGGACTLIQAALVLCSCKCEADRWKANATLRIYGNTWIYNGPFPYKGRAPTDKTVRDASSALAHEYNVHINVAKDGVTPLVDNLEERTFTSESECKGECERTSKAVDALFKSILGSTQQGEKKR
jgi:RHS repeat-associated protein